MRLGLFVACALVAYDCSLKATGAERQMLFSDGALAVWWIAAFLWLLIGFRVLLNGAE